MPTKQQRKKTCLLCFWKKRQWKWETVSYSLDKLNKTIKNYSKQNICKVFKAEFPKIDEREFRKLVEPLIDVLKWVKEPYRTTDCFNRIFNKTKHKLLVYRYKGKVSYLLSKETERELLKEHAEARKNRSELKSSASDDNLDYLVEKAETAKKYLQIIIDRLILRFRKAGANRWISGPGRCAELFSL